MSVLWEALENTASEALRLLHEARVVSVSEIAIYRQLCLHSFADH